MSIFSSICVYCASSNAVDSCYLTLASEVGARIARNGQQLVYGGGHVGLMGACADAALEAGGEVIGVIPQCLVEREVAHENLTALHVTDTMQARQQKMADLSDAFIVLPGGIGTLAEFFEIITWQQLGLHTKPIYVLNAFGYWNDLLAMFDKARNEKFLYKSQPDIFDVCDDLSQLSEKLSSLPSGCEKM